jgi:hypothetical protein
MLMTLALGGWEVGLALVCDVAFTRRIIFGDLTYSSNENKRKCAGICCNADGQGFRWLRCETMRPRG